MAFEGFTAEAFRWFEGLHGGSCAMSGVYASISSSGLYVGSGYRAGVV